MSTLTRDDLDLTAHNDRIYQLMLKTLHLIDDTLAQNPRAKAVVDDLVYCYRCGAVPVNNAEHALCGACEIEEAEARLER